jgi:hypothetical protein
VLRAIGLCIGSEGKRGRGYTVAGADFEEIGGMIGIKRATLGTAHVYKSKKPTENGNHMTKTVGRRSA